MAHNMDNITNDNAAQYYASMEKALIACPVCKSDDHEQLFDRDRYRMGIVTTGCKSCGMIFINPQPTPAAMLDFYVNHYRKFYESMATPTLEYIAKGPFQARADFVVGALRDVIRIDQPKRPNLPKATQTMLDIGCSEGTLLKTFGESFPTFECYGLEPDANFAQFASKNSNAKKVVATDFESFFAANEQRYDLVTLTHVLEHILDPIEILTSIRNVLQPGGHFYVEVPNVMDPEALGLGNLHIGHVMSFSPQTLKLVLAKAGFEVVRFYETGLPAKTKAMSAICKVAGEGFDYRTFFDDFKSRICVA